MSRQQQIRFVYRRPIKGFYSIERVFALIKKEEDQSGTDDIVLPFNSNGLISIVLNILWLMRYRKGVFHVTGHAHYAVLGLPSKRTMLTIHDLGFLDSNYGIKRWLLKLIFLQLPLKRVAILTTISEKTKQEIMKHTGCASDRILVVPNPADPGLFLSRKPFNAIEPRILFLGTKSNKNLERSIAALAGLPLHLRIIGELEGQQEELLIKFKINYSNVTGLSDQDLWSEYDQCDLVLFPSLYEGFGLPIIEAFQSGKPIVTSSIEPMKSLSGGAAYLTDPSSIKSIRQSVLTAIQDGSERTSKIERGKAIAALFDPSGIRATYRQLWNQLLCVE